MNKPAGVGLLVVVAAVIALVIVAKPDLADDPMPDAGASPRFAWARGLYGPSDEDEIDAVAADADGSVYLSGKFEDTLEIDGDNSTLRSRGHADIMVVKYDRHGVWQWTRHFGGPGEDNIFDAICDDDGNLIISGYFEDTVQFGDHTLESHGALDMVVAKIDPDGAVMWAHNFGGSGRDGGNEVVVSPDGRIIVGAGSDGTFEGIANTGSQDAYLVSLTANGDIDWIRAVTGGGDARAKAVEVDSGGNVYLGGDYRGDTVLEIGAQRWEFDEFGGRDAYLVSFTPDGDYRWHRHWGSDGVDFAKGIAMTSDDDVYVVGQFHGRVAFSDTSLDSTNGTQDLFVWKLDQDGDTIWLRQVASSDKLSGAEVTVDADNRLIFGLGITNDTRFQLDDDYQTVSACGTVRCPVLVVYDPDGMAIDILVADASQDGRFGELSIVGNRLYIDVEAIGGTYTFGPSTITAMSGSKDAVVVAVDLR